MIQNQNKEEENYYPISLQISIWNDMNSKLTIIFFVCTNYKSIYLSHPILLTCPIFMLPTCSFNNPPPYFGFYVQTLRKKQVFCIDFVTKFQLQTTIATKISLVTLDKLHAILITNDKEYWMKKNQQVQVHPLTPLYLYYYMLLKCNYFAHN